MSRCFACSLSATLALSVACASTPKASPDAEAAAADAAKAAAVVEATKNATPEFVRTPRVPLTPSAEALAILAAPDRSDADRALDVGRGSAEMLTFLAITPGMKTAELMAGGGYTVELLARAVGEKGVVYGSNPKFVLEKFAEKPWSERLAKPVNKNVVRVDRELDDPLPPEAKDLDLVVMSLIYHDTTWLKTDRAKMNAAIFSALKPGGSFVVIDHSARPGRGVEDASTAHRIEDAFVKAEVMAAGFVLESEAQFLRNPEDDRDWNPSPGAAGERRGTSDRFVLRFKKPAK